MLVNLKVKKLHPAAQIPEHASEGAACFDLHAFIDPDAPEDKPASFVVPPGGAIDFGTGLSFAVQPGFAMMIYSRSGHGFRSGVRLSNSVGIIDSDYRGEVRVKLHNDGKDPFEVKHGDRIAQAMVSQVPIVNIVETAVLSQTSRGAAGFGSTGT